jgi:uncharacterized protein YgiM (DUF1202 family)
MRGSNANSVALIAALLMSACSDGPDKAPSIGEAYVGPMTLNIRQDISLKSHVVATVKHGDELEVLSVRRRFMRVRSAAGAEGWVDSEKLLTTEQMGRLRAVAEVAAKLPVQAEATVYDARNVHTEPHRQSPSFAQLKEEEKFLVLGHKLVERGAYASEVTKEIEKASAPLPRKKKAEKTARNKSKSKDKDEVELPPLPAPPPVPANWKQLSYREPLDEEGDPKPAPKSALESSGLALVIRQPKELPKYEDWSLIRTKDGRAGWILTRSMTMTIPDDVAKYAEGHRITSWFELGEVQDGDVTKKHYLWTTIAKGGERYEFDGVRIFFYNARRHRYETGFRMRDVKGYFPSAVHPVDVIEGKKEYTTPGFSLVLETETGTLERRTYSFEGYRTRLISTTPWSRLEDPLDLKALAITRKANEPPKPEPGLLDKLKSKMPWNKKS